MPLAVANRAANIEHMVDSIRLEAIGNKNGVIISLITKANTQPRGSMTTDAHHGIYPNETNASVMHAIIDHLHIVSKKEFSLTDK